MRIDANGGEIVRARVVAEAMDLELRSFRFQQRMVDQRGDRGFVLQDIFRRHRYL
jgi:hypothetical protein